MRRALFENLKMLAGKHIWTELPEGGQPFHLNYEKAMREPIFRRYISMMLTAMSEVPTLVTW